MAGFCYEIVKNALLNLKFWWLKVTHLFPSLEHRWRFFGFLFSCKPSTIADDWPEQRPCSTLAWKKQKQTHFIFWFFLWTICQVHTGLGNLMAANRFPYQANGFSRWNHIGGSVSIWWSEFDHYIGSTLLDRFKGKIRKIRSPKIIWTTHFNPQNRQERTPMLGWWFRIWFRIIGSSSGVCIKHFSFRITWTWKISFKSYSSAWHWQAWKFQKWCSFRMLLKGAKKVWPELAKCSLGWFNEFPRPFTVNLHRPSELAEANLEKRTSSLALSKKTTKSRVSCCLVNCALLKSKKFIRTVLDPSNWVTQSSTCH